MKKLCSDPQYRFKDDFDADETGKHLASLSFGKNYALLRNLLGVQVKELFQYVSEIKGDNPYPPVIPNFKSKAPPSSPIPPKRTLVNGQEKNKKEERKDESLSASIFSFSIEKENAVLSPSIQHLEENLLFQLQSTFKEGKMIQHPGGFQLQIRKSKINHPASGHGVFVKGHIIPGTVVAVYPGAIYFPRTLRPEIIKVSFILFF